MHKGGKSAGDSVCQSEQQPVRSTNPACFKGFSTYLEHLHSMINGSSYRGRLPQAAVGHVCCRQQVQMRRTYLRRFMLIPFLPLLLVVLSCAGLQVP